MTYSTDQEVFEPQHAEHVKEVIMHDHFQQDVCHVLQPFLRYQD